jgi:hypothetical protein
MRHIPASLSPRSDIDDAMVRCELFAPQHARRTRRGDYSLLHAPIPEHSILIVCGFNGTSVRRGC